MAGRRECPSTRSTKRTCWSSCTRCRSQDGRPEKLFRLLQQKNLLFVGCGFVDWLARFFIRLGVSTRLSAAGGKTDWFIERLPPALPNSLSFSITSAAAPSTFRWDRSSLWHLRRKTAARPDPHTRPARASGPSAIPHATSWRARYSWATPARTGRSSSASASAGSQRHRLLVRPPATHRRRRLGEQNHPQRQRLFSCSC